MEDAWMFEPTPPLLRALTLRALTPNGPYDN
jgi:hypothetical protein